MSCYVIGRQAEINTLASSILAIIIRFVTFEPI